MLAKVSKWGNSRALRIPKDFALDLGLDYGTSVELRAVDGQLHVIPQREPRYTLEELVAQITPENRHDEIDWGPPVGNEVWQRKSFVLIRAACLAFTLCAILYKQSRDRICHACQSAKKGNSRAVRIPKALAEEAGLKVGNEVDMRFQDGEIRIRRARKPKRFDLDELLASVPVDFEPEEWDIGPPVGKEIW